MGLLKEMLSSADKGSPLARKRLAMPCALSKSSACKACHGRGFLFEAMGAMSRARLCDCVRNCSGCLGSAQRVEDGCAKACRSPSPLKVVHLLNQAQIPSRFAHAHVGVFKNLTGNCLQAMQQVRYWLHRYKPGANNRGLVISGPVGVGKTYMLAALAKSLTTLGVSVRFVDFFQLLTHIRATYSDNRSEQSVLGPLHDVDVLLIDELGKGRDTDFEAVVLDQMVMRRYNENKVIVASTNFAIDAGALECKDLDSPNFHHIGSLRKRIGDRIFSRLVETADFIVVDGKDYRKNKEARNDMPTRL